MRLKNLAVAAAIALPSLLLWSGSASASIVGADFTENLDLPGTGSGPRVESNLGVALPSAGPQLTAADTIANPSSWNNSLNVSFDAATDILSLTGDGTNDYTTISVILSNIVFSNGAFITGITPISTGNAVFPGAGALNISESFTNNSFQVSYVAGAGIWPQDFNIRGSTDTFQVTLGGGVPEPSTWALMIGGFGGLGAMLRRRSRTALAA